MTNKHMIFVVIPAGKFPKTRKQLAKDTGKKAIMDIDTPVFYADADSRIAFTNLDTLEAFCRSKKVTPRFVEAGGR
jgi:hypothetical protein